MDKFQELSYIERGRLIISRDRQIRSNFEARVCVPVLKRAVLSLSEQFCACLQENDYTYNDLMSFYDWKRLINELHKSDPSEYVLYCVGNMLFEKDIDKLLNLFRELSLSVTIITDLNNFFQYFKSLDLIGFKVIIKIDDLENASLSSIIKFLYLDNFWLSSDVTLENARHVELYVDNCCKLKVKNLLFRFVNNFPKTTVQTSLSLINRYLKLPINHPLCTKNIEFDSSGIRLLAETYELILNKMISCNINIVAIPYLLSEEIGHFYKNHRNLIKIGLCSSPWTKAFITASGKVHLCRGIVIGNCIEQSFWKIWFSRSANMVRDFLINHRLPMCTRCFDFYL